MEAQEEFVLQFHLNLVLERENGPFRVLDSFSFFSFSNFSFGSHFQLNANAMLMMLMTGLSTKYLYYKSGMLHATNQTPQQESQTH